MGDDRAPLWPSGVVGSISHTDVYRVAAVAKSPPYRSLGVDAEPDVPLEESLWPEICTARELNWLTRQPEPVRGLLCHVLFVLKECVYKYQSPITKTLLDFQDVEVTLDSRAQRFEAELLRPALAGFPAGSTLRGRFLIAQGLIVAALY